VKLGGLTITIVNDVNQNDPTGYDGVGNPVYGDPALTVVNNCDIQQHRTSREISTTDVIVSRDRLFAPPTAPLQPTSIVVIGAINSWPLPDDDTTTVWYLVDGDPAAWNTRNGVLHHYEVYLRRQTG
jgi:hypothetical protein